jgi:hypothetical protein
MVKGLSCFRASSASVFDETCGEEAEVIDAVKYL